MDKLGDRISTLETRLKQLKAKHAAVEARKKSTTLRRQRRDDVRRNVLVGSIVLKKVAAGEFDKEKLWRWLRADLKREEDRELFDGLRGGNGNAGAV